MQVVEDYRQIVLSKVPMIDVRAPVEYTKGTILDAVNLPLMNDEERRLVGTCYKEQGQQSAITLGHSLVCGDVRQSRVEAWCRYFDEHPNTHIFCFRGGLRSRISQQWIVETGRDIPLIKGGYKAFRTFLINTGDRLVAASKMHVVGGQTGCGKTELLDALGDTLDLEGLANHRGSSFGKNVTPQPSQIDFENAIAAQLLTLEAKGIEDIVLEDESRTIGRCALPQALREKKQQSPVYLLEDSFDNRVKRILKDYVIDMTAQFTARYGDDGFEQFALYLQNALSGIRKRLGAKRHEEMQLVLQNALSTQQSRNDVSGHLEWIAVLLGEYYDPLYQYQIGNKRDRVVFVGSRDELLQLLRSRRQAGLNG